MAILESQARTIDLLRKLKESRANSVKVDILSNRAYSETQTRIQIGFSPFTELKSQSTQLSQFFLGSSQHPIVNMMSPTINSCLTRPVKCESFEYISDHLISNYTTSGTQNCHVTSTKDMQEVLKVPFVSSSASRKKTIKKHEKMWRKTRVVNEKTGRLNNQMQCKICKKKFGKLSNIKNHIRTHTGSRPYSCILCSKTFIQQGNRDRHQ